MSHRWDLDLDADSHDYPARMQVVEQHDELRVEIAYANLANLNCTITAATTATETCRITISPSSSGCAG